MQVSKNDASPSPATLANARPLRVAVMLDSFVVQTWVKHVLGQLNRSELFELVMLISKDNGQRGSGRLKTRSSGQLFRAWERFDHGVFSKRKNRPDAIKLVPFVPEPSVRQVHLSHTGEHLVGTELGTLSKADLDVLLDFTSEATTFEMQDCARYGLWSLGSLPNGWLFAHMYRGGDIEVRLDVVQKGTPGSLQCARFATDFLSMFRNGNVLLWRKADAILRTLAGLHRFGWDYVEGRLHKGESAKSVVPDNMTMALFLIRLLVRATGRALTRIFLREDWFIAYRRKSKILDPESAPTEFTVLRAPCDRFYADPFIAEKNGRTYIFFEDYRLDRRKGLISCVEVDSAGNCGEPEVVLETNYHLSYPCVFEWKGDMYLLPESSATGMVGIFRATDFPRGWRSERILIKGHSGLDPTILEYKEKFWLFVTGFNGPAGLSTNDDELFLFFSDTPFGPWAPHPKNPVISDVRSGRPAGRLFFEDGQLIRPSQNSSKRYGYAVSLNRIDVLSETEYAETPIASIDPDWLQGNLGTHTYNQNDKYQVIDGRVWVTFLTRSRKFVEKVRVQGPIVRRP